MTGRAAQLPGRSRSGSSRSGSSWRHRRGTLRVVAPEETWRRIAPHLRDFGITRVADVTGLDTIGIPVVMAIRPNAHTLSVSQGKGLTPMLARVSAVMEAIELHHAERLGPGSRHAPARDLPLPYRLDQLQRGARSLAGDDLVLEWVDGAGLRTGRPVPVPADYVRMSGLSTGAWAPPVFATSTNRLASGNTYAEAALHGLLELLERDCLAHIARLGVHEQSRLDPDSVDDPDCRALLDLFRGAGVVVEILDVTGAGDVPCYRADAWSPDLPLIFSGSGCHPCAAVALSRALTEAAQGRLTAISGSRDDLGTRVYQLQADPFLRSPQPLPRGRTVAFRENATALDDLDAELAALVDRIGARTGVEPIGIDLGRPAGCAAVVKVVAPGLLFDARHETHRRGSGPAAGPARG